MEDPKTTRLRSAWSTLAVVILALATHSPSLQTGLFADDFVHHHVLEHGRFGPTLRPWALFDFGTALAFEQADSDLAGVPWWTATDWKARFWRPVASLWIWAEHSLSPQPQGHQAAALGLFALLVGVVHRFALQLGLTPRAATLGAALFSLQTSTHIPVAWTANRNSLLEATFGVLALALALAATRRTGRGATCVAWSAILAALLATLSKESGLLFLGLIAWLLGVAPRTAEVDPSGARTRRPTLASIALVAMLAYPLLWSATGHGSTSLYYPVPWEQPTLVLERGLLLGTVGLLSLVSPASLDLLVFHPELPLTRLTIGLGTALAAALALCLLPPALRRTAAAPPDPSHARPAHPFLIAWLLTTLAAQAPAPPSDRLLLVPAIPAMLLLGALADRAWRRSHSAAHRAAVATVLTLLASSAILDLVLRQTALAAAAREARQAHADLVRFDGDLILLQLPNALTGLGLGPAVRRAGGDPERRPWPLQFGRGEVTLTRSDDRQLTIDSPGGSLLSNAVERVFGSFDSVPHGPTAPGARAGSRHRTGPLQWTVTRGATEAARRDHLPALESIDLRVEGPPSDPLPTLLRWTEHGWEPVDWPPLGESRTLPAARSSARLAP